MSYDTKTASRFNAPAYFVNIEGITTKEYATHPVKAAVLTKVIVMETPSGTSQRLAPLQNRATVGEVRIRLKDKNGDISALVGTEKASPLVPTLINRKMTLYGGYRDEPESEYRALFAGEIRGIELVGPAVFEFTVVEKKRRYEENMMAGATAVFTLKVAATALAGATVVRVESAQDVVDASTLLLYRRGGEQYEKVTVASHNAATGDVTLTAALAYSWSPTAGDVLTNAPFLRGNIINIFYSLLRNSFSTSPAATAFPLQDYAGSPSGLAHPLADADLDLTSLATVRDNLLGEFDVDVLFARPTRARAFFQDQIYPLGFFPVVLGNGKLSLKAFIPPGPLSASPVKIQKEHMLDFPAWSRRIAEHVNRAVISGDRSLAESTLVSLATVEDTTDQTNTTEVAEFALQSDLLRSGLRGASIASEIAQRVLRRFKAPPIEIEVPLLFTKRGLSVGDIVSLTHSGLPNTVTGALGLTDRLMEVIEVNVNYPRGVVEVTLIETAFGRFAWLGPSSMADYPAASATEKLYAYWGDTANKVNAGAEDGYLIY